MRFRVTLEGVFEAANASDAGYQLGDYFNGIGYAFATPEDPTPEGERGPKWIEVDARLEPIDSAGAREPTMSHHSPALYLAAAPITGAVENRVDR